MHASHEKRRSDATVEEKPGTVSSSEADAGTACVSPWLGLKSRAFPGVPFDNTVTRRRGRSLVIACAIGDGSRSPKGSAIHMERSTLFGAWMACGLNPFH